MKEINKFFNKLDMIEIIDIFKIDIDYFDISKVKLSKKLLQYINDHETFIPSLDYFINDKKELVEYLSKPNQIKVAQFQRKEIMYIAKNILLYSKHKSFVHTCFKNDYELQEQANYIRMFGDIPTVRRAITELNIYYPTKFELYISPKIKYEISRRNKLKAVRPIVEFKYGKFTLFEIL